MSGIVIIQSLVNIVFVRLYIEEAYAFYSGQILHSARKEAGVTQSELAQRINSSKSYISKIEKGHINPSAGLFFSIINALGMRVEIVKSI